MRRFVLCLALVATPAAAYCPGDDCYDDLNRQSERMIERNRERAFERMQEDNYQGSYQYGPRPLYQNNWPCYYCAYGQPPYPSYR